MNNNIKTKSISLNSNLCKFSNNNDSNTAVNKFLPISYYRSGLGSGQPTNKKVFTSDRIAPYRQASTGYRTVHRPSPILSSYYSKTSTLLSEKSCPKIKEAIEAAKITCQKTNTVNGAQKPGKPKKSIKQKIIDELKHYYYGFKLLGLNTKISFKLGIKKIRGIELTRRENNLFIQTVADLFRLLPFSAFVIIPFLELTLPIFIKLFPGMLPTTFETKDQKEAKLKQSLKMKLKMAKFLQETLDNMSVCGKGHTSELAKEFADFFEKVRKEGVVIPADEMLKFSKLFKDEITLDSLPRPQLVALCRVLEIKPIGTLSVLKYLLTLKLRSLIVDDKMIQKEGVDTLTMSELQDACKSRGMAAYGLNENRLKQQLTQWLDLSLNERVPPLLLLLSRAFSLTPNMPTSDLLKKAISALPYCVGGSTEVDLCERCGTIDNKSKLKAVEEEERKVNAEIEECIRERKMQLSNAGKASDDTCNLVDKAPVLTDKFEIGKVTSTDLKTLECAIENLCSEKNKLIIEKSKITELKTELNCYQKHLNDLEGVTKSTTTEKVKESEAAKQLLKGLNKIITDIDQVFKKLEEKELVGTKITIDW
ncbi:unnamed protein product [Aphis gossypii]|uniref:Letm1 RBD domain-containing protein n=1 Tax=Aphis gossypii TaxID=80765 RepID=A0A9P0JCW6_APHGO|nr:unnamed protein product [Aphis gossypii]